MNARNATRQYNASVDDYLGGSNYRDDTVEVRNAQPAIEDDAMMEAIRALGFYPRRNVLEKLAQTLAGEIGRSKFRADLVREGDVALFDVNEQRPAPDSVEGGRKLSDNQQMFVDNLLSDMAASAEALRAVVTEYTEQVGDPKAEGSQLSYAIQRTDEGSWRRIHDVHQAIDFYYERARLNEKQKQEQEKKAQHHQGSEFLNQSNEARAASALAGL